MERPNSAFELAWSSLDGAIDGSGWRTIAVEAAGPIAIHAGRRFPENQEAMLVRFPTLKFGSSAKLPDGQGFSVEHVDPRGDVRRTERVARDAPAIPRGRGRAGGSAGSHLARHAMREG